MGTNNITDSLIDAEIIKSAAEDIDLLISEDDQTAAQEDSNNLKPNIFIDVALDSEFKDSKFITLQLKVSGYFIKKSKEKINFDFKIVIINKIYVDYCTAKVTTKFFQETGTYTVFVDPQEFENKSVLFEKIMDHLTNYHNLEYDISSNKFIPVSMNAYFYYSLKDINFSFGPSFMRKEYIKKNSKLKQFRSLTGSMDFKAEYSSTTYMVNVKFKDLFGLDKQGLEASAESSGLKFKKDDLFNPYKTNMEESIKNHPYEFLVYGIRDAEILLEILDSNIQSFNKMLEEIFLIKDKTCSYNRYNIPLTIGSLVNSMFLKYLDKVIYKDSLVVKIALFKHSILNNKSPTYQKNLEFLKEISKYKNSIELLEALENGDIDKKEAHKIVYNKQTYLYTATECASSRYIVQTTNNTFLYPLSFVSGGRVVNENPTTMLLEKAVDIDITGAYGSVLAKTPYIIGKPHYFTHSVNEKCVETLGSFLQKYRKNINKAPFKITVQGKLNFSQDLIFSRILDPTNFKKNSTDLDETDPDSFDNSAPFVLLRREIINGSITRPILDLIDKVATKKEKKSLYNLKVTSAVYWLDSERVNTIEELTDLYLEDQGTYTFDYNLQTTVDSRKHYWTSFELKDIIQPLMSKRAYLKKNKLNISLQNMIKLFINTLYGVICSVYFLLNNVCIAEFITSSIRVSSYLMCKAFNFNLTITDGGPAELNNLNRIEGVKKPGLESLSNLSQLKTHRSIKRVSLSNLDWEDIVNQKKISQYPLNRIARAAQAHLILFWRNYQVKIDYKIEIKNFILYGSYLQKAHYAFQTYDFNNNKPSDQLFYKIRGFKYSSENSFQNPIYLIFLHLTCKEGRERYSKPWKIPNNQVYISNYSLRIKGWKKTINSEGYSNLGKDFLPGDFYTKEMTFRLNNPHIFFSNEVDYKKSSRRTKYTVLKNGVTQVSQLFERYLEFGSFEEMISKMNSNNLD